MKKTLSRAPHNIRSNYCSMAFLYKILISKYVAIGLCVGPEMRD